MAETALATIPVQPAPQALPHQRIVEVDLSKLTKAQMRYLSKERSKERRMEMLRLGFDTAKGVVTHPITLLLGSFAVGNWMLYNKEYADKPEEKPPFPSIDGEYEANFIGYSILAILMAKSGAIEGIADIIKAININPFD